MKRIKLGSLAVLALIGGEMAQAHAACKEPSSSQQESLFSQLDRSHKKMYNSMDCEGKKMAMKLANQSCQGKNSCAGLNSCATENNSCAGKASCSGNSPGPFTDKNKAVEVAHQYMMNKRSGSMGG